MTEYKIVRWIQKEKDSTEEFEKDIESMIKGGWEPIGGVNIHFFNNGISSQIILYQAMIKTR